MKQRENGWSKPNAWSQSYAIDWIFSNLWSNSLCLTWSSRGYSEMFTGRTVSLWPAFAHLNKSRNVLGWILCFWSKKTSTETSLSCTATFVAGWDARGLLPCPWPDTRSLLGYNRHIQFMCRDPGLLYDVFHIFQHICFSAPERMREKPQNGLG